MEEEILYYVIPNETFLAQGRLFKEGEEYPVFKKDEKYVILQAQNGNFCFSKKRMDQAIDVYGFKLKECDE